MDNLVMVDDDDDADSDIIDFGRLRPTQEEEDAIGRAVTLDDESVAGSPTSLTRHDSSVLPRDLEEVRRRRASQLSS